MCRYMGIHRYLPRRKPVLTYTPRKEIVMLQGKQCEDLLPIITTISLVLFIGCVVTRFYVDQIHTALIARFFTLVPDSLVFESFSGNDTALNTSLYLYNLTNEHAVLNGAKPVFTEVGPFRYKKQTFKSDVKFSDESPPRYLQYKATTYYFQVHDEMSADPFVGKVTSLDLFTAAMTLKSNAITQFVDAAPFITRPPYEIIWGYSYGLIKACGLMSICPNSKISVFVTENGTSENEFVIKTGVDDINELGKVVKFNGQSVLNVWKSEYANYINGSDGFSLGPGLTVGSQRYLFAHGACRSVMMEAMKEVPHPAYPELKVLLFEPASEDKMDHSVYPSPQEFCQGQSYEPKCAPKGFVALSPCLKNNSYLPIYGSQGHFIGADHSIRNRFHGIPEPDYNLDRTYMLVDPVTGITLGAHQVLQLNYYIDNPSLKSLPYQNMAGNLFFPIMRIVMDVSADVDALKTIHTLVHGSKYWINIAIYIFGGLCLVAFFATMAIILKMNRNRS
ncbi:unnamed protein product [Trichobilharzia szidati]|nr:unnamed protein product [Trichobilharzia szidati]